MLLNYIFNFTLLFFLFLNGSVTSHSVNQRKELLCLLINNKYFAGFLPTFFPEDDTKLFNNPELLDALSKACTEFTSSHDVSTHYTDLVCKYFDNVECAVDSQEYFNGCALVPKSCLLLKTVPLLGYDGHQVSVFDHHQLLSFLYLYRNTKLLGAIENRRVRYLPKSVEKVIPYSDFVYDAQYQLDVSVAMGLLIDSFTHGDLYRETTNLCIVDNPKVLLLLRNLELLVAKFIFNYGLRVFNFKNDGLDVVSPTKYLKGYRGTRHDLQLVARNIFKDFDYLTIVDLLDKLADPLNQYLVKLTPANKEFGALFVKKFIDDAHFSAVRVSNINKDEIQLSDETTKFLTNLCFDREKTHFSLARCFFNGKKHKQIVQNVGGAEYLNLRAIAILEREGRTTNEKEKNRSKLGQWWRDFTYRLKYGLPSVKFWQREGFKNAVASAKEGLVNTRDLLTLKKYRKEGGLKRDKQRLKEGINNLKFWEKPGFKKGVEDAQFWKREGFRQGVDNLKFWNNDDFKVKKGNFLNKLRLGKGQGEEAAPLLDDESVEGLAGDVAKGAVEDGLYEFGDAAGVGSEKAEDASSVADSGFGSVVDANASVGGDLVKHHGALDQGLGETVGEIAAGGEE